MKILMVHNRYKITGGEDVQTEEDFSLLKENGIDIESFYVSNETLDTKNKLKLAINTIWSYRYYNKLLNKIKSEKFDIIHIQNFFPLLSPSILYAAKKAGAKVVMAVHNYRLICPNALMFIEDKICTECVGKTIPYPALLKKCYRNSYSTTGATVAMLSFHNIINTWRSKIDGLICISEFVKKQLMLGGFKEEQLHIKYNFVSSNIAPNYDPDDYYIYVGRISVEKGIDLLLNTFQLNQKKIVLIGNGPLNSTVEESAKRNSNITFMGKLPLEETYRKIAKAKALIFPSTWNEPFGRTIIEAFAHGTPVIGSCLGAGPELVKEGYNGLSFDPYKKSDLKRAIDEFEKITEYQSLRKNAYLSYQNNFTPSSNYQQVIEIYNKILSSQQTLK